MRRVLDVLNNTKSKNIVIKLGSKLGGRILFEGDINKCFVHCGMGLLECHCKVTHSDSEDIYVSVYKESFEEVYLND